MPCIHRGRIIARIEAGGLLMNQLRIASEVRADKVTVPRSPERSILQAKFEISNLSRLPVADQPVIGVSTVVAFLDEADVVVDAPGILQCLARAHQFRLAV